MFRDEGIDDGVYVINISIHDEDDLTLFENDAAAMPSFSAMKNDIFVSCPAQNTSPIY